MVIRKESDIYMIKTQMRSTKSLSYSENCRVVWDSNVISQLASEFFCWNDWWKKFRQVTEIETTTSLGSKEPHQADELYLVTRLEKTSSSNIGRSGTSRYRSNECISQDAEWMRVVPRKFKPFRLFWDEKALFNSRFERTSPRIISRKGKNNGNTL